MDDLDKAVQLFSDQPSPYYNRGVILTYLGEKVKARIDFQTTLTLNPDNQLKMDTESWIKKLN